MTSTVKLVQGHHQKRDDTAFRGVYQHAYEVKTRTLPENTSPISTRTFKVVATVVTTTADTGGMYFTLTKSVLIK